MIRAAALINASGRAYRCGRALNSEFYGRGALRGIVHLGVCAKVRKNMEKRNNYRRAVEQKHGRAGRVYAGSKTDLQPHRLEIITGRGGGGKGKGEMGKCKKTLKNDTKCYAVIKK